MTATSRVWGVINLTLISIGINVGKEISHYHPTTRSDWAKIWLWLLITRITWLTAPPSTSGPVTSPSSSSLWPTTPLRWRIFVRTCLSRAGLHPTSWRNYKNDPAQPRSGLYCREGCLLTFHWKTNKENILVIMKMMSSGHQLHKLYDRVTVSVPPVRVAQHQKKRFPNVEQLVAGWETSLSFISDMALINCVPHFRRPGQDIPTPHLLTPPPLHTGNPHWSIPSPPLTSPLFR